MASDQKDLVRLIDSARAIIYDFDGPVCSVFSDLPSDQVARELESASGRTFGTDDPLEIIHHVDPDELQSMEDLLIAAEMRAVESSKETPGALESMTAAIASGRRVAVVSNNAAAAVERFCARVGVAGRVWPVIGRAYRMPHRMKPAPWPMRAALDALALRPSEVVFVGDSLTDVEVARACEVPCIGYANKPGKREALGEAGAFVIDSMWDLRALLAR
ncbi:HAD family hydrolase [Amycolatopsis mediterranei]|uniref:HAD family hydrolase n=1 Tax=Amycolatopsis mediterranei TaxID=33910 RepID=UPI003443C077